MQTLCLSTGDQRIGDPPMRRQPRATWKRHSRSAPARERLATKKVSAVSMAACTAPSRWRKASEHEGQWQGFETQISRYVDDGLTVVVLTNLGSAKPERIAHDVAAIYLSKSAAP
jgi:hypothetical protein